jgi:hypothetical protein
MLQFAAMLRTPATLRERPSTPPIGRPAPPLRRSFSLPEREPGGAPSDLDARLDRAARLGPRFVPPPAPQPVQRQSDSEDEVDGDLSDDEREDDLSTLHEFMGAKQQGKVSTTHGKSYPGPISMQGKRADQVTRHFTNLVLNRLTHDQAQTDAKHKPVEVQMSSVGGQLLLSTNDPHATRALHAGIQSAGSPLAYVRGADATKPAMDQDKERPKRYLAKLEKALANGRGWQDPEKRHAAESDEDVARANAILTALQSTTADLISRDRPDEKALKRLKKGKAAPHLHLVEHAEGDLKTEHAERVQTKLRAEHLEGLENALSMPPTGPKTTCLGCDVFHQVNYPKLAPQSPYTGAYFGGSSPASTAKERKKAGKRLRKRPSTGSISQHGYVRNSDYPDSDSDDEGQPALPRPHSKGFVVPFDGEAPPEISWLTTSGERFFPRSLKKTKIEKQIAGKKRGRSTSSADTTEPKAPKQPLRKRTKRETTPKAPKQPPRKRTKRKTTTKD